MINSDVQLFWANNENNDIVIIYDMDEKDRNKKYTCPVCGSEVKPVAIGGMTKDGKVAQVSSHFSHFDASKCNNETAIHWWFKNKILINGDSFIIKTDVENKYKCKEVLIEQSYNTSYGIYRPDITIITECGKTIYFEMNYTNKKKVEDYLDKWLELGNPVVEVDLKTLMNASFSKNTYEFRALFYNGKCFNVKDNESNLYHSTIGKYKEKIINQLNAQKQKEELKKLDWLWKDIRRYKEGKISIEDIVNLIQSIEEKNSKEIVVDILKRAYCNQVLKDYVNFTKNNIISKLKLDVIDFNTDNIKINYSIKVPHSIYDRIYCAYTLNFVTENGITVASKIIGNDFANIDINNIKNEYNSSLFGYEYALNYINNTVGYFRNTNYIDECTYPTLNYYFSQYYNEHRLYLNDFYGSIGKYLGIGYTNDKILSYLSSYLCLEKLFTENELLNLDKISNQLKIYFSNITIKSKIIRGHIFSVDIIYQGIHSIFSKKKEEIVNFNDLYNIITTKINKQIKTINNEKDIDILLDNLNNKYQVVKGNWNFYLYRQKIGIRKGIDDIDYIGEKLISDYKKNVITLDNLIISLEKEISNYIRFYIYGKKEEK